MSYATGTPFAIYAKKSSLIATFLINYPRTVFFFQFSGKVTVCDLELKEDALVSLTFVSNYIKMSRFLVI